ncbi:hypothetical protein KP509_23G081900 [Ceratopteris richardii]|nr:hypothetical protein KP509_23G081900 [Ceratopteris richardii]
MMSCARNYMEDQLLGFVLVPLKALYGQGKQSLEYCLTSTDFFYTPAGTVHLSLCISDRNSVTSGELSPQTEVKTCPCPPCCAFPQVINCGGKSATQANMSKVEFLDLEAGAEDPHLVSIYYKMANGTSFEEEKESRNSVDYSSHAQCPNEQGNAHLSLPGEVHSASPKANDTSVDVSQIQVHVSLAGSVDDDDMADGKMKYNAMHAPLYFPALEDLSQVKEISNNIIRASDTDGVQAPSAAACVNKQFREIATEVTHEAVALNSAEVVSTCQTDRLVLSGNIPHGMGMAEPDRNVKQEHFVDLYLKSLQQFKDKVADMNFSLDINAQDLAALRSVQVDSKVLEMRRKEGYRLYYGSRAFY